MTIGIYASNNTSKISKEINKDIRRICKAYNNILQIHGLYIDEKEKIISFDIIYDFVEKNTESINNEIINKLKENYNDYTITIITDKDIS